MKKLYEDFKKARNVDISLEEFKILVVSYPVYKVASADGHFDETEQKLLTEIIYNFLSEIFENHLIDEEKHQLAKILIDDLEYINSEKDTLDEKFMTVLEEFPPELRTSIGELLDDMAEISGGVDDSEKDMINNIQNNYLN